MSRYTGEYQEDRSHIVRRATKFEFGLLFSVLLQLVGLVWGASKLSAGVDELTRNFSQLSVNLKELQTSSMEIAVLRARISELERYRNFHESQTSK